MTAASVTIIGIDCAVDPKKRGIAIGTLGGDLCTISLPERTWTDANIANLVAECIQHSGKVLIAIDAPLGWPTSISSVLANHQAGRPLSTEANALFRRITDQFIKEKIGQQPLDVGADRIARTAHAALGILEKVSDLTGNDVPLAWSPEFSGIAAIEVYPAATLKVCGLPHSGYKEKVHRDVREKILNGLQQSLVMPDNIGTLLDNADNLDAVVCVLAGHDFLVSRSYIPENKDLACKEGWIWVREKDHS